ncbi:MAG: hypothetical protein O2816_02275 [Planctomycetota bacterium]|nr:hypothetical protein [Planctomycetota bacterium]
MRILLALTLLVASCAGPASNPQPREPIAAEHLLVETLNGDALDLRGRPVALVYWQSW